MAFRHAPLLTPKRPNENTRNTNAWTFGYRPEQRNVVVPAGKCAVKNDPSECSQAGAVTTPCLICLVTDDKAIAFDSLCSSPLATRQETCYENGIDAINCWHDGTDRFCDEPLGVWRLAPTGELGGQKIQDVLNNWDLTDKASLRTTH